MGGRHCCVINCRRRSHDHLGRKIPNGLSFHCFPSWRTQEGKQISRLTKRRRAAWVAAVGRSDITFNHIPSSMRVCSRHFHSGKPAYEMLESDPDWVPSLHLGHNEGTPRRPERLLQSVQEHREQNQGSPAEMSPSHETESAAAGDETDFCVPAAGATSTRYGKPAYERLESDPDWVPSLHLGHNDGSSRRPERLLQSVQEDREQNKKFKSKSKTRDLKQRRRKRPLQSVKEEDEEPAGGAERPAVRPWREVKSLLQSALQRQTTFSKQPVKKTDLNFRDFFRDALEASLEASSRSRALAARQPSSSSSEFSVKLSFKVPPVMEEKQTCENCVKLQSRIMELQEKLSHHTGEQEDMEDSFVLNEAPVQPGQELQSPETAHTEEVPPEWTEPLSPPAEAEGYPAVGSSKRNPYRKTRSFLKAWLKMFWFLRYSPTLDLMWCHVCRLHSDKSQRGNGLIRGSRVFRFHNIRNHSLSNYHKANVSRHMLHMCSLQM